MDPRRDLGNVTEFAHNLMIGFAFSISDLLDGCLIGAAQSALEIGR